MAADGGTFVEALYAYSYQAADGRQIAFTEGEIFTLIKKSNEDWWHVKRDGEKPMYVPATYMKELCEKQEICFLGDNKQALSRSASSLGSDDCFNECDGSYSDQHSPSKLKENGINERRKSRESQDQRNSISDHRPFDVKSITKETSVSEPYVLSLLPFFLFKQNHEGTNEVLQSHLLFGQHKLLYSNIF